MAHLINAKAASWLLSALCVAGAAAHFALSAPTTPSDAPPPHDAAQPPPAQPRSAQQASPATPPSRAPKAQSAHKAGASPRRPASPVLQVPWGSAPGQLGHSIPEEGAPEGPMTVTADASGRIFVLDQINARIAVFDAGAPTGEIPLPGDTFQDLDFFGRDGFVLLDRHMSSSLAFLDAKGHVSHEVALVGLGVREGTSVTAIFSRADGVWAEVEHTGVVQITDASGKPSRPRRFAAGRSTGDELAVRAALDPAKASVVLSRAEVGLPARDFARVAFAMKPSAITGLEVLPGGNVFVSAQLFEERPVAPFDVVASDHTLTLLGPGGELLDQQSIPDHEGPEEVFRPARLGADGAIYALRFAHEGAEVWRYAP